MPDANFVSPDYRIAYEKPGASKRPCACFRWLLLCLLACSQNLAVAAYPEISFSAESIEHEDFILRDVKARLDGQGSFGLEAGQARLSAMDREFAALSLEGVLQELTLENGRIQLKSEVRSGAFEGQVEFLNDSGKLFLELDLARQDLPGLTDREGLPPELGWLSRGYLDAVLRLRQQPGASPEVTLQLKAGDVGFDSPEGRFAADALSIDTEVSWSGGQWLSPGVRGTVQSGELLLDDFYRNFSDGGMEFSLRPEWKEDRIFISSFGFSDRQSLTVQGRAVLPGRADPESWRLEVSRLDLEFPLAYERYIESLAAPWTLNGLTVTGSVAWNGKWSGGEFHSGILETTGLSVVDTQRKRFAVTGLDVSMRPGDHGFDSTLAWRGLLLGRINLGNGELALDSEPGTFAIVQPLVLDVLGGQLKVHELRVLLPGQPGNDAGEPDIRLRADLDELDMEQLTAAFGWPYFSGKISGRIPGVSMEDGVLDVEGEILVDVFDGQVLLDHLRIERPFGVLPSLAANVEIADLDLELLTSTFSFGRISGRIGGYIRDLRMLDWKPVAFDAWLGTPGDQRKKKGISRKAVNHLTTLGGGTATTALTSPFLRVFNNFSYKRLGLGCLMQNNVCEIRGVSEDDVSVLIMEGAGIPNVTIRAFNRKVDWPQLLAHLVAASEGEGVRVGD